MIKICLLLKFIAKLSIVILKFNCLIWFEIVLKVFFLFKFGFYTLFLLQRVKKKEALGVYKRKRIKDGEELFVL